MNYYIQGSPARAEEIKAAFGKLGYDVLDFGFADKTVVYCSIGGYGGCVQCLPYSINLMNILHSHPDYKELELPVEPKFKVGDWTASIDDEGDVTVERIVNLRGNKVLLVDTDGCFTEYPKGELESCHIWTIADAKDGDVLVDEYTDTIGIFEETNGIYWNSKIYCAKSISTKVYHHGGSHHIKFVKPATKEQRDLLFAKMREAGYEWDANKKELKKIQHYDISNFHAGMPVLVRDDNGDEWNYLLFSHYRKKLSDHFFAGGSPWFQCIPFNDETKHLLGTTDMPDERFINW